MKKSAYYSDIIFAFLLAFLFSVCLLRYLKVGLLPALLCAVLFGLSAGLLASRLLQKKHDSVLLKKREETEAEKLALHLALLSPAKQVAFFLPRVELFADGFLLPFVRRPKRSPFIEGETAVGFFRFGLEPVSADCLLPVVTAKTEKAIYLFCNDLTTEAARWCTRFSVRAVTIGGVYKTLKEKGALPESYLKSGVLAAKKKRKFRLWLSKQNASRFLTAGALVLLSSLISPFPYYYLAFAFLLLTSALCLKLFGFER